ncbi:UNVERIFIED_CONTAM: putative serine/threonine-protein kinase [Sesamum calycinum]|uniref:non-specific serine/threonine protein kinase n=1 Tax=Sesamum calycinum TaxID=2727403 RepID=A0AAW2SZ54_9LAMI
MSVLDTAFVDTELSKKTSIFGLHLWVVIGIVVGAVIVLIPSNLFASLPRAAGAAARALPEIQIDMGKVEHRVVFSDRGASSGESRATSGAETGSFGDENVIGEGGYGIVYYGMLADNTKVAIKNLLNNRGQAEKEFKVEVEAIGRVRHKNLVRLLGYCVEGAYRMLVYEYIDNGNLDHLAYLHEGLEPKVVHRDIKSSNILLDRNWHPKLSDFGLAKLLNSERSYVTTRVMGTFGYVAPEYACTGMLNEKSDIYSFGILIMEIITGRAPVDYSRPPGEVNLIDWLKMMVGNRKSEEVVDPKLPERPASKALKRVILVALRCVDPDAQKRPKMGHVIHMLESEDLLSRDERRIARDSSSSLREEPSASRLEQQTKQ